MRRSGHVRIGSAKPPEAPRCAHVWGRRTAYRKVCRKCKAVGP